MPETQRHFRSPCFFAAQLQVHFIDFVKTEKRHTSLDAIISFTLFDRERKTLHPVHSRL